MQQNPWKNPLKPDHLNNKFVFLKQWEDIHQYMNEKWASSKKSLDLSHYFE